PPVVRAVLMAALVFLAFAVDRENDGITTVLTVLMVVGIFAPCTFVSVSLQMSFAAVLGILLLDQPIQRTLTALLPAAWAEGPWAGKILPGLAVSISASLAALPVTAVYFERISVLAPLTNLAVLWLVPVLMGGGILLLLLAPIPAAAAVFARFGLEPLLRLFLCIVAWFAGLPWNSVAAGDGLAFGLLALWGIWLCAGFSIRPRIRLAAGAFLLCLTLTLSGMRLYAASQILTCTVWADGMVIVQQGGKMLGVLPDGTETLADAYTDRFFELGKSGADLLIFTDSAGETQGKTFCAGQILRPGTAGEDAGPLPKEPEGAAVRLGEMTVAVWGSNGMPQGVTVQWKDRTILCACGTQQVLSAPDLAKADEEADLLILDSTLSGSGNGLDHLLARTAPRRILVCDPGKDADLARIGQIAGQPVEWVREAEPWMTEWKEEE
ncbi:MAG: ComEC/Rec2 family competence protein, partial [Butyricicoccaceae bacterium]